MLTTPIGSARSKVEQIQECCFELAAYVSISYYFAAGLQFIWIIYNI